MWLYVTLKKQARLSSQLPGGQVARSQSRGLEYVVANEVKLRFGSRERQNTPNT